MACLLDQAPSIGASLHIKLHALIDRGNGGVFCPGAQVQAEAIDRLGEGAGKSGAGGKKSKGYTQDDGFTQMPVKFRSSHLDVSVAFLAFLGASICAG